MVYLFCSKTHPEGRLSKFRSKDKGFLPNLQELRRLIASF
jgi:hypothetical protein